MSFVGKMEKLKTSSSFMRTTSESTSGKTKKAFFKNKYCDVRLVLVNVAVLSIFVPILTTTVLCAKLDTKLKMLINNEDQQMWAIPQEEEEEAEIQSKTQMDKENLLNKYAYAKGDDNLLNVRQNLYESELKRLSYETIHRILRDENEPDNELRAYEKRSVNIKQHDHKKRSLPNIEANRTTTPSPFLLNKDENNLSYFDLQDNCPILKQISLKGNHLKSLNLDKCKDLEILNLSRNNFPKIPLFPENSSMVSLNLNHNDIEEDIFPPMKRLKEVHLSDNKIKSLSNLDLSGLKVLETLDLSCNRIGNVETAFFPQRMQSLKHLNLAFNELSSIYRESFYNLLSLNTLILSHNHITDIDYETFLALPNLQHLDLSFNQLKGEAIRALQGIPDLMSLSIAFNPLIGISMQEFVASWSLKELDASGTGLCKIPAALAQSVRTLKLTHNYLKLINCGDLDSYPLLQYLDLSNSHIEGIEDDALGRLEILETLFLDHNKLKKIPMSLPITLKQLFLNDNEIMDIQLAAFQGLNNLETLDLSGNRLLLYLPALQLPKLLTLNLQSSGITGVNQAIIHTLPKIRDLLLDENPIKCSDLLSIAEWATPCLEFSFFTNFPDRIDEGKSKERAEGREIGTFQRINLKKKFVQEYDFYNHFQRDCQEKFEQNLKEGREMQPNCFNSKYLKGNTTLASNQTNLGNQKTKVGSRSQSKSETKGKWVGESAEKPLSKLEAISNKDKEISIAAFNQEISLATTETMQQKSNLEKKANPLMKPTLAEQQQGQVKIPESSADEKEKPIFETNEVNDFEKSLQSGRKVTKANVAVFERKTTMDSGFVARNNNLHLRGTTIPFKSLATPATIFSTKPTQIVLKVEELQQQVNQKVTNPYHNTFQNLKPNSNSSKTSLERMDTSSAATSAQTRRPTPATTELTKFSLKVSTLKVKESSFATPIYMPQTITEEIESDRGEMDNRIEQAYVSPNEKVNGGNLQKPKVQGLEKYEKIIRNKKQSDGPAKSTEPRIRVFNSNVTSGQQGKLHENIENAVENFKQILASQGVVPTATIEATTTIPYIETIASNHHYPQHKHEPLQLHLKDRHLIGTPLLMHKGENILVESEQLRLLPTTKKTTSITGKATTVAPPLNPIEVTATIPITINHLAKSQNIPLSEIIKPTMALEADKPAQKHQQHQNPHNEGNYEIADNNTDKIKKDQLMMPKNIKRFEDKKKLSLTMKKMTVLTKHTVNPPALHSESRKGEELETRKSTTEPNLHHQQHFINTPILEHEKDLTTFAQHERLESLLEENHNSALPAHQTKSEQWLDLKKVGSSGHPGLVICISISLFIVLLVGLAYVFRCNKPWSRHLSQQRRPHLQMPLNEDDSDSFLTYQKWQLHSNASQNYNSPLHSLHVRELQKTTNLTEKPPRNATYPSTSFEIKSSSACSSESRSASSSCSNSIQLSPQNPSNPIETFAADCYYVEMPSSSSQNHNSDLLPMELLSLSRKNLTEESNTFSASGNQISTSSTTATSSLLNDEMEDEAKIRQKLTTNPSRKISIW